MSRFIHFAHFLKRKWKALTGYPVDTFERMRVDWLRLFLFMEYFMERKHGVFVPAFIWRLKISCIERLLLAHIYYHSERSEAQECTTTDKRLSQEFEVSTTTISKIIKNLDERGYIKREVKMVAPPMWANDHNPITTRFLFINHKVLGGE